MEITPQDTVAIMQKLLVSLNQVIQTGYLYYLSICKKGIVSPLNIFTNIDELAKKLSLTLSCSFDSIKSCLDEIKTPATTKKIGPNESIACDIMSARQPTIFFTDHNTDIKYYVRRYKNNQALIAKIADDLPKTRSV